MSKVYLAEKTALDAHTGNNTKHVTQAEKTKINSALTAASVAPATGADLTKLIATIGGKQIFAPEGGGGGGGGGGGTFLVQTGYSADGDGSASITIDGITIEQNATFFFIRKNGRTLVSIDGGDSRDLPKFVFLPVPSNGKVTVSYDDGEWCYVSKNGVHVPKGECDVNAGDEFYIVGQTCLPFLAPILMADGTTRRICDIRVGDFVMSVNPDTGALEADRVVACDGDTDKRHDTKDVWHFDDGSVIETVHRHRVYNVDLGEPMYMEAWNIGERCYREDGSSPRLVSHERVSGDWRHCTLFTEKWNNYFANGILCGNRKSAKLTIGG